MPIPSSKELRANPTGRMREGWNTCKKIEVRTYESKPDEDGKTRTSIILKLRNQAGEEQDDWLDLNNPKHRFRFAKLSEIFGMEWDSSDTESTVARAFEKKIEFVDAKIQWAKGDKSYVTDYAECGEGTDDKDEKPRAKKEPEPEPEPEPETAKKKPGRW